METTIQISPETLDEIRKKLKKYWGSFNLLSERTGYDSQYISQVLTGKIKISEKNKIILTSAKSLLDELDKKGKDFEMTLKK